MYWTTLRRRAAHTVGKREIVSKCSIIAKTCSRTTREMAHQATVRLLRWAVSLGEFRQLLGLDGEPCPVASGL